MIIYLAPVEDRYLEEDMKRMQGLGLDGVTLIASHENYTVRYLVQRISDPKCTTLVVPDDYRRHNYLIEQVKACAYHMEVPVLPLTRLILRVKRIVRNLPSPEHASVCANPKAGEGVGMLPAPVG